MTPDASRSHAFLLMQQGRMDLAEPALRRALAQEPEDATLHAGLSVALDRLGRLAEALAEADRAVELAPYLGTGHLARSRVFVTLRRPYQASEAAREALRLNPVDTDALLQLAISQTLLGDHAQALVVAEEALRLDPSRADVANVRANVLVQLDRPREAVSVAETLLARVPDVSAIHANLGWALLNHRREHQALASFREALRLRPGNEWACQGTKLAMKARNPAYRSFLRSLLWVQRSPREDRTVLFGVGFVVGLIIPPLLALYLLLGFLLIVSRPLSDVLLLQDPFGRDLLTRDEAVGAVLVSGGLLSGLALLLAGAFHGLGLALAGALVVVLVAPLAGTVQQRGVRRWVAGLYTAGLAAIGGRFAWALAAGDGNAAVSFGISFGIGGLGFVYLLALLSRPWRR